MYIYVCIYYATTCVSPVAFAVRPFQQRHQIIHCRTIRRRSMAVYCVSDGEVYGVIKITYSVYWCHACFKGNYLTFSSQGSLSKIYKKNFSVKSCSLCKARFPWSVFWSGFGADFVRALYAPGKALPGAYKARTKSAPNPLQNTLHGKRALK